MSMEANLPICPSCGADFEFLNDVGSNVYVCGHIFPKGMQSSFPSCEVCGVTLHDGDGRIGKEHPTCWPTCPKQQLATPDETGAITLRMDETEVRVDGSSRIKMSNQEALPTRRLSWTQPLCRLCWNVRNPDRIATTVVEAERETCCECGSSTRSGIYVRVDPTTVPYPMEKTDDE